MLNNQLSRPLVFGPNVNCVRVGEVEPTGSSKGVIIGHGASGVIYGWLHYKSFMNTIQCLFIWKSGGLPSNRCRKGDVTLAGSCPTNNWPNYLESYMICAGRGKLANQLVNSFIRNQRNFFLMQPRMWISHAILITALRSFKTASLSESFPSRIIASRPLTTLQFTFDWLPTITGSGKRLIPNQ